MHDRAAQFAPFAALTGYEAAVGKTARLTDERRELDPQEGESSGVTTGRFPLSHAKRPHVLREEVVGRRARGGSWR